MRVSSNEAAGYRTAEIVGQRRDLLEYSDPSVGEKLWVSVTAIDFLMIYFRGVGSQVIYKLKMIFWILMTFLTFTDIFHNLKRFGNFIAILLTYLISASLHGLNFQLAAVLLSIGVFTFVEYRLRNVLAEILDACVAANKCSLDSTSSCASKGHKNTSALAWVKMINFAFGIFTVVLLAYLGVLLDTSIDQSKGFSWERNLKKWIELKFFGHIIVSIWFGMYLTLRNWKLCKIS